MTNENQPQDLQEAKSRKDLDFEASLKELEKIVDRLEQGDVPLEEALDKFQEGIKLSRKLKQELDQADQLLFEVMKEDQGEDEADLEEKE